MAIVRRGFMLVLSSPSGAGKTVLARRLLEVEEELDLSVSVTTRPRRSEEVDGRDYRFVNARTFEAMRIGGDLLEQAEVFGHSYATPAEPVEAATVAGRDVLFDIDWQGANQLQQAAGADVVCVFILPPSMEELRERLHRRAQDSAEEVAKRMAGAAEELSHYEAYDYVIVNEDLEKSLGELRAILHAERLKRVRQPGLADFVEKLKG